MVTTKNAETISLFDRALKLPADQREELGHRLLDSLEESNLTDEEVRMAWRAEIQKRIRDWKSGKSIPLDGDELLKEWERREAEEES